MFHTSEIQFVYGAPNDTSAAATLLSGVMLDYWISFATSLNPNDGLGNKRIISSLLFLFYGNSSFMLSLGPTWSQYTTQNQVRSLSIASTGLISDVRFFVTLLGLDATEWRRFANDS